jgi:hypothetical protein
MGASTKDVIFVIRGFGLDSTTAQGEVAYASDISDEAGCSFVQHSVSSERGGDTSSGMIERFTSMRHAVLIARWSSYSVEVAPASHQASDVKTSVGGTN